MFINVHTIQISKIKIFIFRIAWNKMNYNLRSKSKITPIDQPNEVVLKKAGRRGRPKKVNTATEVNEQLSESNETAAAINERINNVENELNEKEEDDFIRLENENIYIE